LAFIKRTLFILLIVSAVVYLGDQSVANHTQENSNMYNKTDFMEIFGNDDLPPPLSAEE
jgi:hypothetical protein